MTSEMRFRCLIFIHMLVSVGRVYAAVTHKHKHQLREEYIIPHFASHNLRHILYNHTHTHIRKTSMPSPGAMEDQL